MRRLILGLAAIALLLVGVLFSLAQGPSTDGRAGQKAEVAEEPVAPAQETVAPSAGPPWRVSGRVIESNGTPVAGAIVGTALIGTPWDDPPDTVRTDESGRYEIDISRFRSDERLTAYVQVTADGYLPGWRSYAVEAGLAGQPVAETCDIFVRRGAGIAGRVVDSSGRPVAGALANLVTARNPVEGMSVADRAGRFLLGAGSTGTHGMVLARAPGFREGRSARIEVSPDVAIDVGDIVLRPGLVVEGHMRYADGAPVAGALVQSGARYSWFDREFLRTAADGSFRIGSLEEGKCRILLAGWVGGRAQPEAIPEAGARDALLTVSGGRIRLRILDEEGAPLRGARALCFVGEARDANLWFGAGQAHAGEEVSYFAPYGTICILVAEAEGRVPAEARVQVPSDRNESEVVLRLVPLAPTARLRIEMNGPDATPFQVRIMTPIARRHVMALHHDGTGTPVLAVPAGSWLLEIQPGDSRLPFFEPIATAVEIAPDRDNVVRLATLVCGRVRLQVKADPFFMAGFKGMLVRAEDGTEIPLKEFAEGITWTGNLDANKATLARALLRPGLYQVRVDLPRHERFETTIRIDGAVITDVVAEMVKLKE